MVNKKLDIGKLEGQFKIPDLQYVSVSDLDTANELRLTFEVSFGIGLTLLGASFSQESTALWMTSIAFILFGLIMLYRYVMKLKKFKE